jgi:hypothetical protein
MNKTVPVTQYYKGKPIATYTSMSVAARLSGAYVSNISEVVNGGRSTAGGYSWKRAGARSGSIFAYTTGGSLVASFRGQEGLESGVTSVPISRVLQVLRGQRATAGGLVWTE